VSIRTDVLDDIERLAQTNGNLVEVARDLLKYIDVPTANDRHNVTSESIVQTFIERYKTDLSEEHFTYLQHVLGQNFEVSDDLVVVHEITPSTDDPHNITSFLADGGIGRVWLAQDKQVQREVVLKQLLPSYQDREGARTRFVHEAQVTGSLQHPNIVPVYSMNWDNGDSPFYTMKYIRGETLAQRLEDHHRKTRTEAGDFQLLLSGFLSVCQAIAYSHEQGVIHRDLKPENIAIGEFGEVTVLDWGLAEHIQNDSSARLTTGVLGTPNYMPPEQASGQGITDRYSDIYSLGAILFEILCGKPPRHPSCQSQGLSTLLESIVAGNIPDATTNCPNKLKSLGYIANKCLSLEPSSRYLTVSELITDIHSWENDQPLVAKPDTALASLHRTIRHKRKAIFALCILLPIITFVLAGFITKYNIEFTNLQSAKREEVLKQEEHLKVKQELATAIRLSAKAEAHAEASALSAKNNSRLAAESLVVYRKEQLLAEQAQNENRVATRTANDAESTTLEGRKKKLAARTIALNSKAAADALKRQIQLQVFETLSRNADNSASNLQYHRALAWTSAAIQQAQTANLGALLQLQRLKYDALRTKIPKLHSVNSHKLPDSGLIHDPNADFIYLTTMDNSIPLASPTIEKRSVHTLQTIWEQPITGTCIAHAFHADSATHCVVYQPSAGNAAVVFYDTENGKRQSSGTLDLPLPITNLYLTAERLVFVEEHSLAIYDRRSLELINRTPSGEYPIYASVLSPKENRIATIHGRHTLRLWDASEGLLLSEPLQSKPAIIKFSFQPLSNHLQLVTTTGEQILVDASNFVPSPISTSQLPLSVNETVTHAVFHAHQLLTAYGTSLGRLLISNSSGSLATAPIQLPQPITGLSLSKDQRMLLIQTGEYIANVFDIAQRKFICRNLEHPSRLDGLTISHDNRYLLGNLETGEIRKWDLAISSNPAARISIGVGYIHSHFRHDKIISVTASGLTELRNAGPTYEVLDTSGTRLPISENDRFIPYDNGFFFVGKQRIAYISYDDHKITTGQQVLVAPVNAIAFNEQTGSLALAHSDRTISIYSPNGNPVYKRLEGYGVSYEAIDWGSPDSLLGMRTDPNEQVTHVDRLVVDEAKITHMTTLPGTGYQFIQDTDRNTVIANKVGTVFLPTKDNGYTALGGFAAGLHNRHLPNPTVGFTKNGYAQQIHNGTILKYDIVAPEDVTPTTATGYFAVVADDNATLYRVGDSEAVSPPIHLGKAPNSIDLEATPHSIRLISATNSGIHVYHLATSDSSAFPIKVESNALTGMIAINNGYLKRSENDAMDAYESLTQPLDGRAPSPLEWLQVHSSRINREDWSTILDARKSQWKNNLRLTSQQATGLLDSLVLAQIGAREYRNAISTLLQGFSRSKQNKHLYQACMLSLWLQDTALSRKAFLAFQDHTDFTAPQEFVRFSLAAGLYDSPLDLSSLDEAYSRIKSTSTTNPVVLRALLINAIRLQESASIQEYLQRLLQSRAPIPLRNSGLAIALQNAPASPKNKRLLESLQHSKTLTPAIREGNPGANWTERCVIEITLRDLQLYFEETVNE